MYVCLDGGRSRLLYRARNCEILDVALGVTSCYIMLPRSIYLLAKVTWLCFGSASVLYPHVLRGRVHDDSIIFFGHSAGLLTRKFLSNHEKVRLDRLIFIAKACSNLNEDVFCPMFFVSFRFPKNGNRDSELNNLTPVTKVHQTYGWGQHAAVFLHVSLDFELAIATDDFRRTEKLDKKRPGLERLLRSCLVGAL